MGLLLPLIYIICFTYSLSLFIKTKFERLLPFTFVISGLMLFISGFIFKTFYVGLILCILFALIFPIHLIKKKMSISDIKKKYITKGLIAFLAVYVVVYLLDFNRFFTRWDELSHWGKMVKEMIKLDSFYSVPTSNLLVHKDYPPIMSLIEMFYCFLSGGFKEVYLIRCMHLFEGCLVISCLSFDKKSTKETIFKTIISMILIYLCTFLFDTAIVINCIYTDYVLALFVACTLYQIFKNKEFSYNELILLSLSCIFLLLLKQISIAFYLMILFLIFGIAIINKYKWNLKRIGITLVLLLILPISLLYTWNHYIDSLGIKGQFEVSDIKIDTLVPMLKGNYGEPWQKETIANYQAAVISKPILNSNLPFTYAQCMILVFFIGILLAIIIKEKQEKKKEIMVVITLLIGFLGYAILMLLLYIYSFGSIEGPTLASFDRYMSTYVLIALYTLFFIYIKIKDIHISKKINYVIAICILCLLIKPSSIIRLRPDLILLNNHFYDTYKDASKKIDEVASDLDKVFIVDQNEKNGAVFYINYFSNKISTNLLNYELATESDDTENLFYSYYYDYMKEYDYLYTFGINENFKEKYNFLSSNEIKEKTLYKIIKKENKLQLEMIK